MKNNGIFYHNDTIFEKILTVEFVKIKRIINQQHKVHMLDFINFLCLCACTKFSIAVLSKYIDTLQHQ